MFRRQVAASDCKCKRVAMVLSIHGGYIECIILFLDVDKLHLHGVVYACFTFFFFMQMQKTLQVTGLYLFSFLHVCLICGVTSTCSTVGHLQRFAKCFICLPLV